MSEPAVQAKDAWERWQPILERTFWLLLLLAFVLSQTQPDITPVTRLTTLFFSLALLVWYSAGTRRRNWLERPLWLAVYFAIGWLIWYVLVNLNAVFFLVLFALFPYAFMTAPIRYAILFTVILNILVLITLTRFSSEVAAQWMLIVALTTAGAALLGYFVRDIIRQSEERQHLIAELQAAREHLAHTQHEAGILSERHRLAGELHDTIAQGLIGIVTHLEAAENAASTDTDRANNAVNVAHHLEQAKALARSSLQETRRFIWAMRSVVLEDRAFHDGLQHILESWSKTSNLPVNLVTTGTEYPLPSECEFTILRVIQEALANIARHANASQAIVTLSYTPDAILLDINDDGCGFDPEHIQGRGFGLINMRYRVGQLGGTLTVESEAGAGTTIMAHLPVKAAP
jgi:signal transduction histidine kinase